MNEVKQIKEDLSGIKDAVTRMEHLLWHVEAGFSSMVGKKQDLTNELQKLQLICALLSDTVKHIQ